MRHLAPIVLLLLAGAAHAASAVIIDTGQPDLKISSIYRQLVFDMPLTSGHLQSVTVASDRSSLRNHATAIGTPPTFGVTGVTLNGSSDYVKVAVAGWQASDTLGTWAAWINPSSAANGVIMASSDEGANNDFQFLLMVNTGALRFWNEGSGSEDIIDSDTTPISTSTWQHVAVTSNGSRYLLYYNGASIAFTAGTGTDSGDWLDTVLNRDNIAVGANVRVAASAYFPGTIAGVRAYSRELSAAEIMDLYNKGRGGADVIMAP